MPAISNACAPTLIDVTRRERTRSIPSMGHGNTDVFESSDSGSVVSSRQREGPPDSSARWTPGNFEGFLLNTCFVPWVFPELGSLYGFGGLLFTWSCDVHEVKVSASLLDVHAYFSLTRSLQL